MEVTRETRPWVLEDQRDHYRRAAEVLADALSDALTGCGTCPAVKSCNENDSCDEVLLAWAEVTGDVR